MIKANGRSALILAMGLLAGFAAPSHAASDELNVPAFVTPAGNGAQPNAAAQPATENQTAAPNQLNEVDRSQQDNRAAPASTPAASGDTAAARSAPPVAAAGEHSIWDETSLIGKIFIGVGALLTIASAARMFMA